MTAMRARRGYSRRSRLDKLGVKPGMRVAVLRLQDEDFLTELRSRTEDLTTHRPKKHTDMVFFLVHRVPELRRLTRIRSTIVANGVIWVLWRKGRPELKQGEVMSAAKASGLVDIKVVSFSEELSALKLVIPVTART